MKIKKIETNIKRKLYLKESNNKHLSPLPDNLENNIININPDFTFQKILGFGGAITQSVGYAISTVPSDISEKILDEYFSINGLNYTLCRLPIGSCDFSLNSYSYSYKEDLSDFNINQDLQYIIPVIKSAQKQNSRLTFISSPWSPPAFMKDNNSLIFGGKLLEKHKKTWANYLVKYVKEYKKQGININYMTIQNEPNAKQIWESCIYSAEEEAKLLKNYLFPIFKQNNLKTEFLIWDHNKDSVLERTINTLVTNGSLSYAKGIGFHWYMGSHFDSLDMINKLFPDKLLIHTEGCTGYSNFKQQDELFNCEMYAREIIGDLNHNTHGFIDWNIVLDYNGGPNHVKNYCNSPIMINKKKTNYIKTPSFYYIAHFSKYIKPGANRIHFNKFSENILVTAFKNPDKSVIIILLNQTNKNEEYNLCYKNNVLHDNLDSHSIVTFVINGE